MAYIYRYIRTQILGTIECTWMTLESQSPSPFMFPASADSWVMFFSQRDPSVLRWEQWTIKSAAQKVIWCEFYFTEGSNSHALCLIHSHNHSRKTHAKLLWCQGNHCPVVTPDKVRWSLRCCPSSGRVAAPTGGSRGTAACRPTTRFSVSSTQVSWYVRFVVL